MPLGRFSFSRPNWSAGNVEGPPPGAGGGFPNQGFQGMPGQGMQGGGISGQGMPGGGMSGQGMPGGGMQGQGMPGQGFLSQGLQGQGFPMLPGVERFMQRRGGGFSGSTFPGSLGLMGRRGFGPSYPGANQPYQQPEAMPQQASSTLDVEQKPKKGIKDFIAKLMGR